MPKEHQTNGKDAVLTIDTAGNRVARLSRARTQKLLHIATRHNIAVANIGGRAAQNVMSPNGYASSQIKDTQARAVLQKEHWC